MSRPATLSSSRTSLNETEANQSRFRKTYGFKFYGGSSFKRNNFREVSDKPFFYEHPLGPLASKASFNPKATILPDIKSKSVDEIRSNVDLGLKPKNSRRAFSRKTVLEKNPKIKSPPVTEDKVIMEQVCWFSLLYSYLLPAKMLSAKTKFKVNL